MPLRLTPSQRFCKYGFRLPRQDFPFTASTAKKYAPPMAKGGAYRMDAIQLLSRL
jgi:hypothetical protein